MRGNCRDRGGAVDRGRHAPINIIPALLQTARAGGCGIDLSDVTYYVGHETVVPSDSDKGLPRWLEALFAAMQRNSVHVSHYFKLPRDSVAEIGREIAI